MELDEYRRMAAVEDEMWFYRALHRHLEGALMAALNEPLTDSIASRDVKAANAEPIRILDAGCGTGGLMRRLGPRHASWQWTGVDVEPLACEFARSRCDAEIVHGSLLALPFADDTFSAAVCSDVLYHLDDDAAALRELLRVLQPGGVLVINVPAHPWLWSYHDVTVHGRRRYTREGLARTINAVGFKLERSTHWNALPLPLVIVRRKLLPPPASGSDVQLYPKLVEAMFRCGTAVERWWLNSVGSLPCGSSILATVRKPGSVGSLERGFVSSGDRRHG